MNVARLRADGVVLIEPGEGYLSCGATRRRGMASPENFWRDRRGAEG